MKKGSLTREQAVSIVGESAVSDVESQNCEPTGRVGYNGAMQGDDLCEWSSGVSCKDTDGEDVTLLCYYYTTNDDDQVMAENSGDGSYIDWHISGYEIV